MRRSGSHGALHPTQTLLNGTPLRRGEGEERCGAVRWIITRSLPTNQQPPPPPFALGPGAQGLPGQ